MARPNNPGRRSALRHFPPPPGRADDALVEWYMTATRAERPKPSRARLLEADASLLGHLCQRVANGTVDVRRAVVTQSARSVPARAHLNSGMGTIRGHERTRVRVIKDDEVFTIKNKRSLELGKQRSRRHKIARVMMA